MSIILNLSKKHTEEVLCLQTGDQEKSFLLEYEKKKTTGKKNGKFRYTSLFQIKI